MKEIFKKIFNINFLIIFIGSMPSLYYYPKKIPIGYVVFFLLVTFKFYIKKLKIRKRDLYFFLGISIFLILNKILNIKTVNIRNMLPLFLGALSLIYFTNNVIKNKDEIKGKIDILIIIHISFQFVQFIFWSILNIRLDYLNWFSGAPQRLTSGSLFRAAGLFHEPGTYAAFLLGLIIIREIYKERIDKIFILSMISIGLTFSAKGILMLSMFLIIKYLLFHKKIIVKIITMLSMFFSSGFIWYYINRKFEAYGGMNFYLSEYLILFKLSLYEKFKGYGVGYQYISEKTGFGFEGGILFTLFLYFGFLSIVFLFLLSYKSKLYKFNFKFILYILVLSFSKISLNHAFFWMFFSLLGIKDHKRRKL